MPFPSIFTAEAPEFPAELDWVGTETAVRISDLRGRLALLDFWTYGCINCMHMIPQLHSLEERFADVLTVIGVHSGKFVHERATAEIAAASARLGVTHPVLNDRLFRVWRAYGVNAWPTMVLVDARGRIVGMEPGEFDIEQMATTIQRLAEKDAASGDLHRGPSPVKAAAIEAEGGELRFPVRIAVEGDTVWVSDGGHDRVVEARFGADRSRASIVSEWTGFAQPQGLARLDERTYVAERAGHSVWRLDAGGERVRVAGTGRLGRSRVTPGGATATDLRSPWGLEPWGDKLIVTMAGTHQLWTLDPLAEKLELAAGSGREEVTDGPARDAALAQPQGVARDGSLVHFADAESSAVRTLDLATNRVKTIVGTGLFDFGDRDGVGDRVRLQHPSDVLIWDGRLVVADAYNNRLKSIDPATRETRAFAGEAGEPGAFNEPSGLALDGDRLLVADTNNHRIVAVSRTGSLSEIGFDR